MKNFKIQIRKNLTTASFYVVILLVLNSFYNYTSVVGKGVQGDTKIVNNNVRFIHGLL